MIQNFFDQWGIHIYSNIILLHICVLVKPQRPNHFKKSWRQVILNHSKQSLFKLHLKSMKEPFFSELLRYIMQSVISVYIGSVWSSNITKLDYFLMFLHAWLKKRTTWLLQIDNKSELYPRVTWAKCWVRNPPPLSLSPTTGILPMHVFESYFAIYVSLVMAQNVNWSQWQIEKGTLQCHVIL